jgi:hypothetical protein
MIGTAFTPTKLATMRDKLAAILIVLACCSGCMTRQTTNSDGSATSAKSRTLWIWQKDFWAHK